MSIALWQILGGAFQLLFGRRIFWLTVGIVGFLLGIFITMKNLDMPTWLKLVIGLAVGVVFSILAVVMQKPAAAIFGFFALGLSAALVALIFGVGKGSALQWIIFLVGGIIGAILVMKLFNWGLIIGSSLVGAGFVIVGMADIFNFSVYGLLGLFVFLILASIGISYQAKSKR